MSKGLRDLAEQAAWLLIAELLAVVLALAYLLLAIRQNAWCWPAALLSAALFLLLMYRAQLYVQSALQLFYMAMAVYGWWRWRGGAGGETPVVISWPPRAHMPALLLIVVAGLATGMVLAAHTDAAFPFIDALTGWGAVVTTWMVARKVLQNWHYWFVIDVLLVFVYAHQGLWLTAGLFVLYLVLVVVGYRQWRASMARLTAGGHV